jgi:hypothetical protein
MSKKYGVPGVVVILLALGWLGFTAGPAAATKSLFPVFKAKYVQPDSQEPNDVAFAQAVETAKCHVCHVGKKSLNEFGKAVRMSLRKRDFKNPAKAQEGLEKAMSTKSIPDDGNSPTYGELIRQGKLPVSR